MSHHWKPPKFIDEYSARQRNTLFPDAVRNGRLADAFFWKGTPNPSRVQRIAAWMFGLMSIGFGLEFFSFAVKERIEYGFSISVVLSAAFSLLVILLGTRVFRNGFPRPSKPAKD